MHSEKKFMTYIVETFMPWILEMFMPHILEIFMPWILNNDLYTRSSRALDFGRN